MTDFVEWLLARIAEDEAAARAAIHEHEPAVRRFHDGAHAAMDDYEVLPGETAADWHGGTNEDDRGHFWCGVWAGEGIVSIARMDDEHDRATAEHIACHDPARVLAECAAKRRIVDLHRHETKGPGPVLYDGSRDLNEGVFGCVICSCVDDDPGWHFTDGWCQTVRLLGLPYAGREGYDERWRPEEAT